MMDTVLCPASYLKEALTSGPLLKEMALPCVVTEDG